MYKNYLIIFHTEYMFSLLEWIILILPFSGEIAKLLTLSDVKIGRH